MFKKELKKFVKMNIFDDQSFIGFRKYFCQTNIHCILQISGKMTNAT